MDTEKPVFKGSDACPNNESSVTPQIYKSSLTVGPGQKPANPNFAFIVDQKCVDALANGSAIYTLKGVITYDDIFKRTHHTHYCWRYQGMGPYPNYPGIALRQMVACPDGNDVD